MAADASHVPSDVELLHGYLGQCLARNRADLSLDAALAGFEDYYRQLHDLRGKVRQAEQSLARGEGGPLDVEAVIARIRKRLAEQGAGER